METIKRSEVIKSINALPAADQRKFMLIVMDKYNTVDLFKIKQRNLEIELASFIANRILSIKPFVDDINKDKQKLGLN